MDKDVNYGFISEKHLLSNVTYDAMRSTLSQLYRVSAINMPTIFLKNVYQVIGDMNGL